MSVAMPFGFDTREVVNNLMALGRTYLHHCLLPAVDGMFGKILNMLNY